MNWGPVRKNINFISTKPALMTEDSTKMTTKANYDGNDDLSVYSQIGDYEIKPGKKEQFLSELKLALMVKHSDPLQYYSMKQQKKLKIHDESYKKLRDLTKGKKNKQHSTDGGGDKEGASDNESTGGGPEVAMHQTSFRNKMFELLEKTNQRV